VFLAAAVSVGSIWSLSGQTGSPVCRITAVSPAIHSEGVSERLGDILLACSGTPGRAVSGNLTISLNTNVTNKLTSGSTVDAVLSVDSGSGPVLAGVSGQLLSPSQVVFSGLQFQIGPAGGTELRISNLRGDASLAAGTLSNIQALIGFNPPDLLQFTTNNVTVGVPARGLLGTNQQAFVANQIGSALPETLTFSELIEKGTRFASSRVTEGYVSAFEKRASMSDNGVRILIRYRGMPPDARLFVPNAVAGSNAAKPTAAGDFGGTVSGGEYVPGSGTLLLVRIVNTDGNGAGGFPAGSVTFGGPASFDEVGEVALSSGAGIAVYEVYDASPSRIESAQIPTFLGLPRSVEARSITTQRDVYLGPLSNSPTAAARAPVPRFAPQPAPSDCTLAGDCRKHIPKLDTFPQNLDFIALSQANAQSRDISFNNAGGGIMHWITRIEYKGAQGWVKIDPESGVQGKNIRVFITPMGLTPGVHEATLVIDAGEAGVARFPIKLQLNQPAPPLPPQPTVSSISNGATFRPDPLVGGSLATIKGTNLAGSNVTVTFNGVPARILYTSGDQINLQVPAELADAATANLVVTVNGVPSQTASVNLAPVGPGIFEPGILNQDNSVNSAASPARTGTIVQIFATGLLPPGGQAAVEAKLHDQVYTSMPYAGPAPGIPGVQQVNLQIPESWPAMTTEVLLCSTARGVRACSLPVRISIQP
jgi:uncharacterized protein (TIGR03437 family)